jgi:HEAT repeat protein
MKNQLLAATVLMLASGLACAASSSETALTTIDSALHSKNPDTRREAVKALAVLGSKQPYQGRLESMLKDKDGKVRLAAVASLSESKNAPALREALDDQIPEVRFAAAKALFNMNDPAGREALIRILNGDSKTASNFIAEQKREALRTLQTPRPLMIIALRQGVQFVPLPGLGEGISVTEKVLSNSGSSDRAAVATLLGKKKDPQVSAALQHALADKDASVRAAAIQAIALGDDPTLAKDAAALLNDKNQTVRLRAAACYLRLSLIESTKDAVRAADEE